MKAFLAGIVFLIILGIAGYFGLKYYSQKSADSTEKVFKTEAVTKTGRLNKSSIASSDFTHVLVAEGQSTGVASYTLNLDDYIGKQVSVTGQFSGTTLYADSITETQ